MTNSKNMEKLIENKIALVTGGSRGLGKNEALRLAEFGSDVILTYRSKKEEAENVVAEIEAKGQKAIALPLDVAQTASFDDFFTGLKAALQEKWGRDNFDFLVNNAGIDSYGMIAEISEETVDNLYNVHFKGTFFLTQKALPHLADGGRIINTSTGLARFTLPGYAAYASMKGGIEVFTRYLAKELGQAGHYSQCGSPRSDRNGLYRACFQRQPADQGGHCLADSVG